jgi:hypothetical protein
MIDSKSSSVMSTSGAKDPAPALFTQHVEMAEGAEHFAYVRSTSAFARDVGLDGQHAELARHFEQPRVVASGHGHLGAGLRQDAGDAAAIPLVPPVTSTVAFCRFMRAILVGSRLPLRALH